MKTVNIVKGYKDMQLGRRVEVGEHLEVDNNRAEELVNATVGEIIGSTPDSDTKPPLKTPEQVETKKDEPKVPENTKPKRERRSRAKKAE